MAKLTKRVIEKLECDGSKHGTLFWDDELKGFGIRVFPSGQRTFVVKFRTRSGRQRWLRIGAFGPLTAEQARDRAKVELAKVVEGDDPAEDRDRLRAAITLNRLCDLYLEAADAGLVLGRKGLPKKVSSIESDRSRLNAHVRPLLGHIKASEITRADIEAFKKDVVLGRTAKNEKLGFRARSIVKGGKGVVTRTLGTLGAIFVWGGENGYVDTNPVRGVKRFADKQKKAMLTSEQYRWLALALDTLEARRDRNGAPMHSAVGLDAVRFIALTGVRRGEAQHLGWEEVDANGTCVALGETKTGFSLRPLSRAAFAVVDRQPAIADFVFPAGPERKGYGGLSGLWKTVQRTAKRLADEEAATRGEALLETGPLDGLTLHSLRHSFAGVAEQLGATIPTIAALLGHRLGGVTGGYILKRVDILLIDAANRVADHIVLQMNGEAPPSNIIAFQPRGRRPSTPLPLAA
ncbi:tyrosine-type recombinase/integrase [Sphingomonas sp. CCH5-D11]|uniref:tyrosine-type recombinase/integrase n=1 Tax=Sphingomonas sp. CCH5-D11 TaxID=1768786 RepID=UPI000ACA5B0B|nr:integrase arm-type DNA-binding domain-containing protein [Sphingomonas sp. CCH5-D11]